MKEALRPSRAIASSKVGVDAIFTKNALRREYADQTQHLTQQCVSNSFSFANRENANLADVAFWGNNEHGTKSTSVI